MRKLTAVLLFAGGLMTAADKPSVRTLMALDEQFCRDFTDKGVDGWLEHFADDAVVFASGGPITRDRKSLDDYYRKLFGPGKFPLTWKPLGGEIATSGDLGFTYGTWEIKAKDKDGNSISRTGKYQTTWKKQSDGSWKIVADIGNPDSPSH